MKKLLVMILALCVIFSMTSAMAFADGDLVECDDVTLTFCCSAAGNGKYGSEYECSERFSAVHVFNNPQAR